MSQKGYRPLTQHDLLDAESSGTTNKDICQFALPVYVAQGAQGEAELSIMRMGEKTRTISFRYKTVEGSAKAGKAFQHSEGVVEMGPGQENASIKVPILNDPLWNATHEFTVVLSEPKDCELGLYLKVLRVKVIDATPFPSNRFKEQVAKGEEGVKSINEFALLPPLLWLFSKQKNISFYTLLIILIDVLKNIYQYMSLVLSIYIVDRVFNFSRDSGDLMIPHNRLHTAYVIAGMLLLPVLIFFLLDHAVVRMDVTGILRSYVARSLFRKFMNYSKDSTEGTPLPDMVTAMTLDVGELGGGYMKVVGMIRLVGKVCISIYFTLEHNPAAWWAAVSVPAVMMLWTMCRTRIFIRTAGVTGHKESECTAFINEALAKIDLIATYQQRPQMNELYVERAEETRYAKMKESAVILTNMFIPKLLGPALVALYTAVGAQLVINKELKLGVFLATISVFKDICDAFSELFGLVMDVIAILPALKETTVLLNKATDLSAWREAISKREKITLERVKQIRKVDNVPRVDRLEIEVVDVSFTHRGKVGKVAQSLFKNLNYTCPQGKLCCVLGEAGQGRKTLLQLIGHCYFPSTGTLFVPSHLRIVFVSEEICLLNLSVWENLTFGNRMGNNPYRVEKILQYFGMATVKSMCKSDLDKRKKFFDQGGEVFSAQEEAMEQEELGHEQFIVDKMEQLREGEKAEIHLARAFIMNAEVIVMHRPFVHFHSEGAFERVKDAFEKHRDDRGLCMPPTSKPLRRPRTIFYSADTDFQISFADLCWRLPDYQKGKPCAQFQPVELRNGHSRKTSKDIQKQIVPEQRPSSKKSEAASLEEYAFYLPTKLHGMTAVQEDGSTFRADNTLLQTDPAGLAYRISQNPAVIAEDSQQNMPVGSLNKGKDEGDGWIQISQGERGVGPEKSVVTAELQSTSLQTGMPKLPPELLEPVGRKLVPREAESKSFTISITKLQEEKLGLNWEPSDNVNCRVAWVFDGYPIGRWNADNPSLSVQAGDCIIAVNGSIGEREALLTMMAQPATTLTLTVGRR